MSRSSDPFDGAAIIRDARAAIEIAVGLTVAVAVAVTIGGNFRSI